MLKRYQAEKKLETGSETKDGANPSFEILQGDVAHNLLITVDHACNHIPEHYEQLGLPNGEFERHIAYDIGTRELAIQLAAKLNVPAVMSKYSRLLIDPNRGEDDPTLIMQISDGAIIPGNVNLPESEKQLRKTEYYLPYHGAISAMIDDAIARAKPPAVFAIHSFTPSWKGVPRPWHVGVLWKHDGRFALPLINALSSDPTLNVGENQPYQGGMKGESVDKHGLHRGLATALIEIRQDLICDQTGVDEWAERLAKILPTITVR